MTFFFANLGYLALVLLALYLNYKGYYEALLPVLATLIVGYAGVVLALLWNLT